MSFIIFRTANSGGCVPDKMRLTMSRLAAIMDADVVGYSRLIESDEARTLAAIRALRSEVLDSLFAEHGGRVVKLMGDGDRGVWNG